MQLSFVQNVILIYIWEMLRFRNGFLFHEVKVEFLVKNYNKVISIGIIEAVNARI